MRHSCAPRATWDHKRLTVAGSAVPEPRFRSPDVVTAGDCPLLASSPALLLVPCGSGVKAAAAAAEPCPPAGGRVVKGRQLGPPALELSQNSHHSKPVSGSGIVSRSRLLGLLSWLPEFSDRLPELLEWLPGLRGAATASIARPGHPEVAGKARCGQ